jgi:selenocysteine lyase/cysteine desulfurase
MALGREGIGYERVACTSTGLPDENALLAALDQPRVKVLALSWVSFATGYACDLAMLGRACREREIYFVVDAIQGVGAHTLDVRSCHVDILACGGQKWLLSPWGTGFAYVRRELASRLEPRQVGWLAVQGSSDFNRLLDYKLAWYDDARRFEVGTLPYQDLAGFCASLEMLLDLGIDRIEHHIGRLTDSMVARLDESDAELVTPRERSRRAGIVTVRLENAAVASERLARAGIVCSLREGAIRLSPHLYSTHDDVERALDVLQAL